MSTLDHEESRSGSVDALAGLLAGASLALSAIGAGAGLLLEIEAHPARVIPAAVVLAIISARMSSRHERLALVAIFTSMVAFVVGMTLVVLTGNTLV